MDIKARKSKLYKPSSFRSPTESVGIEKSIKNLQSLKAIVGKTNYLPPLGRAGRKQTLTVTAQFQQSLNQLMETLNQANPFFVRCIKSNADKIPYHFDDMLVLVQLRYTGMLETVTIRQSGYSVRLSFDEFIQHYRILLPKGLLSSQCDVKHFLDRMNLNRDNYQIGKTKIFMRESEKLALDDMLHQEILKRIVTLQRWVRTWITRKRFHQMRQAAVVLQTHVRRWLAQQRLVQLKWIAHINWSATVIQKHWRSYCARNAFLRLRAATIVFQSFARGFLARRKFRQEWAQRSRSRPKSAINRSPHVNNHTNNNTNTSHHYSTQQTTTQNPHHPVYGSTNYECLSQNSDEALLSKGSTQEQLESDKSLARIVPAAPSKAKITSSVNITDKFRVSKQLSKDSEDSSGILDDSDEAESIESALKLDEPPPPLPPRRQPTPLMTPERPSISHQVLPVQTRVSSQSQPQQSHPKQSDTPPMHQPLRPLQTHQPQTAQIQPSQKKITTSDKFMPLEEDFDDVPKLDRRRNRPLAKITLKRSKSNKASSELGSDVTKSPSENDITVVKQPVKEMVSEPCMPSSMSKIGLYSGEIFSSASEISSTSIAANNATNNNSHSQRGAFQKAKRHIRTFITGSSKGDKKSKENLTSTSSNSMDWESSSADNQALSSHGNKAKKSKNSSIYSSLLPNNSSSTVSSAPNYSMLKRHNLKSIGSPQKSDICAICANLINQKNNSISNAGFKCTECSLLFHSNCLSSANTVPCMDKNKLAHFSSSSSKLASAAHNPSRPPRNKYRGKTGKNIMEGLQAATAASTSVATNLGKTDMLAFMSQSMSGHPLAKSNDGT